MKTTSLAIPNVILIEPTVYGDHRGFFFESFNEARFNQAVLELGKNDRGGAENDVAENDVAENGGAAIGGTIRFVQDNHSRSARNVLRGLHYQVEQPQGKLIRVVVGEIFDVAVDIRPESATFGQWVGQILSAENKKQMWIPEGFAHGFLTLSESAEILYKTTDYYAPQHERAIAWNDKTLKIAWPLQGEPILSAKDQAAAPLRDRAE